MPIIMCAIWWFKPNAFLPVSFTFLGGGGVGGGGREEFTNVQTIKPGNSCKVPGMALRIPVWYVPDPAQPPQLRSTNLPQLTNKLRATHVRLAFCHRLPRTPSSSFVQLLSPFFPPTQPPAWRGIRLRQ